jgi:hypothetical protein
VDDSVVPVDVTVEDLVSLTDVLVAVQTTNHGISLLVGPADIAFFDLQLLHRRGKKVLQRRPNKIETVELCMEKEVVPGTHCLSRS